MEIEKAQSLFSNLFLLKRKSKLGIGSAYRDAFKMILQDERFDTIITMDADLSHDIHKITTFVSLLGKYDFVIGSRYILGGKIINWSRSRIILSKFANLYIHFVLGMPIHDVTSGFMCFKKSVLSFIQLEDIKAAGYAFLVELKYRVYKKKLSIIESPIVFTERRSGKSKMSLQVIWESIYIPWKIKLT